MTDRRETPGDRIRRGEDPTGQSSDETPAEVPDDAADGDTVTVVVDINEPTELRMQSMAHDAVDDWMETRLSAADYIVNGVGFERKTPADFAGSITEGRLTEQVDKLKDAFDHAYVLLEGEFADFESIGHSRLNPQSMRGMAASLTARHGIPVIPVGDFDGLLDHAIALGRKHTEDPVSSHLPTGSVGTTEPSGKRMWGCFDGVGAEMASRLYDEFGGPAGFFAFHGAAIRQRDFDAAALLQKVDGIGEVTADRIVTEVLGGKSPVPGSDS